MTHAHHCPTCGQTYDCDGYDCADLPDLICTGCVNAELARLGRDELQHLPGVAFVVATAVATVLVIVLGVLVARWLA